MICSKNSPLVVGIAICSLFVTVSCKEKQPKVSEEEFIATEKKMIEVNRIMLSKDKRRIEGYIEREQLDMHESPTGLWYSVQNPESGELIKPEMNVSLEYSVGLLDGMICYSSEKDGIKSFRVGRGGVESGLEEGILMMKAGGTAKFILPPHLAYGLPGDGACIPARAIIVYDIKVLSAE
jgi:FKBP-type peptidyl-prolyl cis-trans isomerase